MNTRMVAMVAIAVVLVTISAWVHLGGEQPYAPPIMTLTELQGLKPDADGDTRLLEELRRQIGYEPDAWRHLPPSGQALFATLYAEEVHHASGWPQMAEVDVSDTGVPGLPAIAEAYATIGVPNQAGLVRVLATQFDKDHAILSAWSAGLKPGHTPPRPSSAGLERLANATFGQLGAIRKTRLAYAIAHAADLGIR